MMLKASLSLICLCFMAFQSTAQTDRVQIEEVLNDFIFGTVYNDPQKIRAAFYPGSDMFLHNDADTVWKISSEAYANFYDNGRKGQRNQRDGRIIAIDIVLDVAFAKLEVIVPAFGKRFYDLLLLKKINGKWLIVGKCTSAEPISKTPTEAKVIPKKETIISDLKKPWSMAFINEQEVLIAEKEGTLLHVDLVRKTKKATLGLPDDVGRAILIDTTQFRPGDFPTGAHGQYHAFNAGWFDIVLDPNFTVNHYVYLSYAGMNTEHAAALKVIRGKLEDGRLREVETIFLADPYSQGLFHFGGGMTFGGDGKLYIAAGERHLFEKNNPVPPVAQDLSDKRGKIFRLNPDGSVPPDNPDFGPNAVPGLFAIGIRATQGMVFDEVSGQIWFSDHGTVQGDELNLLFPGANYGWPYETSGSYRTSDYEPVVPPGLTLTPPVHYWDQTIAPTGLTIYRGSDLPQWAGNIILPGLSKGSLWRIELAKGQVTSLEELFVDDRIRLRKAVVSPRGKLYLLTDEENGKIIRVVNANQ